jgi:3',5'-cyclic AMP phosphodiesterase CpdA
MKPSALQGRLVAVFAVLSLGIGMACSSSPAAPSPGVATPPGQTPGGGNAGPSGPGPTGATVRMVGVGDIGMCGSPGVARTASLVGNLEGQILLVGDIAYLHGTMANFRDCFEPLWGRFRSRWRAVPGNHEYETANAADYYTYFGDASGVDNTGFYSFMAGDWLILMLNSNIPAGRNSAQWEFVRRQIDQQRTPCTMAVWHHPLFSSGPNGNNANMRDLWALLEAAPIEVILNGHDHLYERFARQLSDGSPEPAKGIREFIVGTGGADLYGFFRQSANSEARFSEHGAMQFTLEPAQYRWEYRNVTGTVLDFGLDTCR